MLDSTARREGVGTGAVRRGAGARVGISLMIFVEVSFRGGRVADSKRPSTLTRRVHNHNGDVTGLWTQSYLCMTPSVGVAAPRETVCGLSPMHDTSRSRRRAGRGGGRREWTVEKTPPKR